MNEKFRYGFGAKGTKMEKGMWSFGINLSHALGETYLFINFAKWSLIIGWLAKEK